MTLIIFRDFWSKIRVKKIPGMFIYQKVEFQLGGTI